MENFNNEIIAYALKNAIDFGKVDSGRILPKLFQHGLDRKDIKKIMPEIEAQVKKVNSLSKSEREKMFEKYKHFVKEKVEEEKGLPEIDVSDLPEVVTRLAPEPSKYLHIGHALSFVLNYSYAKKYNGKCLLRFEDTNPEKVSKEYVDSNLEDIRKYLGIEVDSIRFVSDDMEKLYKCAEKLIKYEKAYMCFCDRETLQNFRHEGKECECREKKEKQNREEWGDFLSGKYMKGEAVLRLKGDMKSKNHVMRDPVIFRAIAAKHYKYGDKYKVWPMYDFYNPIEDSLMGVTLILRSNEFEQRVELQDYIKDLLGLKKQKIVQYGRFNVIDFTTKGREIRDLIDSGELIGWDDPRLVTLKALERRGIIREAYFELAQQMGLSKYPVNLDFNMIAAINRKLIDSNALRYSFVESPVRLNIEKKPEIEVVDVSVHPDKKETRQVKVGEIFISRQDFEQYKGKEVRLLHLYNIILNEKSKFTSVENKSIQKLQWVSEHVPVRVLMPEGNWKEGIAESAILKLKPGNIVQFERFGFCRFDGLENGRYNFWFSHR